jgi:hypothetical protein
MNTGSKIQREPKPGALYSVLSIAPSEQMGLVPIAVILLDVVEDCLYLRFRDDLADVADEESWDVLEGMEATLIALAKDKGASGLFELLRETLSNYVRMGEPQVLPVAPDWKEAIDRLFHENVKRDKKPAIKTV